MRTGIERRSLLPGLIAEYDERAAAKHSGIPWPQYAALDLDDPLDRLERVHIVAFYYLDAMIIPAHVQEAREAEMRRKQLKGKPRIF